MKQRFITLLILVFLSVCGLYAQYAEDLKYGSPEIRKKVIENIAKSRETKYLDLLIDYLKDPDPGVRLTVVKALHSMNFKSNIEIYLDNLGDFSPEVCAEIRKTLIDLQDKEILEKLKKNLSENSNPQVRQQIAILFGEAKEKSAINVLINSLKDNDFVRFSAVKALGEIGDLAAEENLIKALSDPVAEIKIQAVRSLVELKSVRSIPYVMNLLLDTDATVKTETEKIMEGFVSSSTVFCFTEAIFKDRRPVIRRYSAKALGILGDKAAVPVLLSAIHDKDLSVKEEAMRSLDVLLDKTYTFNLCLMLNEKDMIIRTYIVKTIERIKDPRAVPGLFDRLRIENNLELRELIQKTVAEISDKSILNVIADGIKDKNQLVRMTSINTVASIKINELLPEMVKSIALEKNVELKIAIIATIKSFSDNSVLPELHKSLLNEKVVDVKLAIIDVMKVFNDYSSIPPLLQCMKTGDESLRSESENMLNQLANIKSVNYFIDAAKDKDPVVRAYAMKIMKDFPTNSAIPVALANLNDKDPYIRTDAVKTLGAIGDKTVMPELSKRLNDSEEDIRLETVKALGQLGDPQVGEYLRQSIKDKAPQVRIEALKILSNYLDSETIGMLNKQLKKESDIDVKQQIIVALSKSGDKASVPVMKKTIKDNDPMIRKYGVMALGELGDKSAIPDLKELFKSDSTSEVKAEVIISLAKLKAKEMMPEFINSLYDSSKEVADASKKALDMLIDASDCSYLAACIQNEHNEVRNYCIITLTRLKNKDCLPDLFATIKNIQGSTRLQVLGLIDSLDDGKNAFNFISLVEKPSTSRDTELQLWVIKHLSAFKNNQETIDYLSQSIRHENGDIRKETVITLGKIGGNKAFEILRYVSNNDASFSVKNLARDVLEKGGSSK